jgi:fucose permease
MTSQAITSGDADRQKFLLVLLFAGFVLTGIEITLVGPMLPVFIARWSLSDSQAGVLSAVQFISSLVGVWLSSAITHHLSSRTSLVLGYFVMAAGLATVNASSIGVAYFALAALGLGYGLVVPGTNLAVAEIGGARSASLVSLVNFAWGVGAVSCSPLVLLALKVGYLSQPLRGIAVLGAVLALSFVFAHFPVGKHVSAEIKKGPDPIVGLRTTFILATMFFLYVGIETSLGFWATEHVQRLAGGLMGVSTLAPMFFYGGLMGGRASAPWILARVHEYRLARMELILVVIGIALFVLARNQQIAFLSLLLAGLGCAAVFPICITWLSRWYGAKSVHMSGIMFSMASLGSSGMPWFVGFVSAHAGGLRSGLMVPLSCAVVMMGLLLLVRKQAVA